MENNHHGSANLWEQELTIMLQSMEKKHFFIGSNL